MLNHKTGGVKQISENKLVVICQVPNNYEFSCPIQLL